MHFPFKFINSVEFNAKFQATQYLSRRRSEPYSFVRIYIFMLFRNFIGTTWGTAPVRYREILNAKYAASLLKALSGILIEQQTKKQNTPNQEYSRFLFFFLVLSTFYECRIVRSPAQAIHQLYILCAYSLLIYVQIVQLQA